MGQPLSPTMTSIFAGLDRKADQTIVLSFPDASVFRFATVPLSLGGHVYDNSLQNVGEIRRSLETATDSVGVGIQNRDRVLGLHVAEHWQKWRKAEAVIGRFYRGGDGLMLTEWVERFRGAVQQPNANDLQVTMDIVIDTVAPGPIVANRTLGLLCPFVYKDPKTCGYTGPLPTCNHNLKSPNGCDGHANSHHFGGMEHRYSTEPAVPGSSGNPDGPPIGPICPRLDQFVLVRGENNKKLAKMVCFFTEQDDLWNPITRRFHRTKRTRIVRDEPIFELISNSGAVGYSSFTHPVLWYRDHAGEPVSKFTPGDPVLCWIKGRLADTRTVLAQSTGEAGDVMEITMEDGLIYCYGDDPEKLILCHNSKGAFDPPIIV